MFAGAYAGRKVLVTGHTGFKGAWMTHWLKELGASVAGYSLAPNTQPSLFDAANLADGMEHHVADVRDADTLAKVVKNFGADIVFHMAAQPLVRESYQDPTGTLNTNIVGTMNLLEAVRTVGAPCAVVVITSDKVYENKEWHYAYREDDPLGGHDIYSTSKACTELVTQSYRRSFFNPEEVDKHGIKVATARAGNVIGPGDWATDRIIPDIVRAFLQNEPVGIRNPNATRPWQHVLEPIAGYLWLGAKLLADFRPTLCSAWNFGPYPEASVPVGKLFEAFSAAWGGGQAETVGNAGQPHEAGLLHLAIDKAVNRIGWHPLWGFESTIDHTAKGYRRLHEGSTDADARQVLSDDIAAYCADGENRKIAWTAAAA